MSDTKAQRLAGALNDFLEASAEVEAAAVVSYDGLAMASALPPDMDEDRLGAMSAALLSLGEQAATGLGRGDLRQVFVEGRHGLVFLMSARGQAVLAAVTGRAAKIGFMLFEMRRAADAIGAILEQASASTPAGVEAVPEPPAGVAAPHHGNGAAVHADIEPSVDDFGGAAAASLPPWR